MAKATPLNEILTGSTSNIMRVLNSANNAQIDAGKEWYERANRLAKKLGEKHNIPVQNVVFAIAALSPIKDWGGKPASDDRISRNRGYKKSNPG